MNKFPFLLTGGCLSIIAALFHIAVIFGGPKWYIYFGAGQKMADMAARGMAYPAIVTLLIAGILAAWGLYAFSGAGLLPKLPFLKFCLVAISVVYLLRGLLPFLIMPFFPNLSGAFWLVTSAICASIGTFYAIGTYGLFRA